MSFKAGKNKTGGRQKGGKNKKTLVLQSFAEMIIEGGMEKFQREMNKLSGKDYVNAYLTLYEFVKPKLARAELKAEPEHGTNALTLIVVDPKNRDSTKPLEEIA